MSTEIANLNEMSNEELMALAGMTSDMENSSSSSLPRLRLYQQPIMGEVEVKGKKKKMEVIEAGMYRLQAADGNFYFAESCSIQMYTQRFMYKRYISAGDNSFYIRTIMADSFKYDLKDSEGSFNCGRPSGYVEDWNALDDATKKVMQDTKRVREVFGVVTMHNPVDAEGNSVELEASPFAWDVQNNTMFKDLGKAVDECGKKYKVPTFRREILCGPAIEHEMNNGDCYYTAPFEVTKGDSLPITEDLIELMKDFNEYIAVYNANIDQQFNEKTVERMEDVDNELVDDFIDVEEVA